MVFEIVQLILMAATLVCGLVVGAYAHGIRAAGESKLAFQEGNDGDQRRLRLETRNHQRAWQKELLNWLGDSRAILEKLLSIAEESSAPECAVPPAPSISRSVSLSLGFCSVPDTTPTSRERLSPDAPRQSTERVVATPTLAPGSARPVPWIATETKSICRECDGGFVAVGNGGIGPCYVCEGVGFVHAP